MKKSEKIQKLPEGVNGQEKFVQTFGNKKAVVSIQEDGWIDLDWMETQKACKKVKTECENTK